MSIDFSKVTGWSTKRGNLVQVADSAGRVIWAVSGGKVILEVEKITSDTYAGETTYTGEQFILLDIYPKTNGTVKVTYGGLTKTITDTSGAEEPNAQRVYFGTFNGVADSVATPTSGTLTIEGDYYAFGESSYATGKTVSSHCDCITAIVEFGNPRKIPSGAFGSLIVGSNTKLTSITIPESVTEIGDYAFYLESDSGITRTITVLSTTPAILALIPFDQKGTNRIIVPRGCGNTYKTTEGWSLYADYIVEAE